MITDQPLCIQLDAGSCADAHLIRPQAWLYSHVEIDSQRPVGARAQSTEFHVTIVHQSIIQRTETRRSILYIIPCSIVCIKSAADELRSALT